MIEATEIRYDKVAKELSVAFGESEKFVFPAELLRIASPSAEVRGHSPDQRKVVAGRRHVAIIGIEPVGNYAVRLIFDDMHDSGLYSWDYLRELGENQGKVWQDYLQDLALRGLSRDP
ncbi:MAG TPA: DUF971 domain-containing protein [Rhodospirillaceae bacterium]|nr:DUF971 domain-containing protein [Rhodospirillaceae bacterium]